MRDRDRNILRRRYSQIARESSTKSNLMCVSATLIEIATKLHTPKIIFNIEEFSKSIGEENGNAYGGSILKIIENGSEKLGLTMQRVSIDPNYRQHIPVPDSLEDKMTIHNLKNYGANTPHLKLFDTGIRNGLIITHAVSITSSVIKTLKDEVAKENGWKDVMVVEFAKR